MSDTLLHDAVSLFWKLLHENASHIAGEARNDESLFFIAGIDAGVRALHPCGITEHFQGE